MDGESIRTRGGHDIADQLPELEALSHLGVDVILDGELVAGAGRPADFYAVIGSVSSRRRDRTQLNFLAFDLLWLDGSWLVDDPHDRPPPAPGATTPAERRHPRRPCLVPRRRP